MSTIWARDKSADIWLLPAALVVFVGAVGLHGVRAPGFDLIPLATAGALVANGDAENLYARDPVVHNRVSQDDFRRTARQLGFAEEPTPFVYPPLIAFLAAPLAVPPFHVTRFLWVVASLSLVVVAGRLAFATYAPSWLTAKRFAAVLIVFAAFEPIRYGLWLGQTTPAIFALVIGSVALQRRGRSFLAGLALALAVFTKLSPIIIVGVWALRPSARRAAVACVVWLLVLWTLSIVIAGIPSHMAYILALHKVSDGVIVAYNNQSLLATIGRFYVPTWSWADWTIHEFPEGIVRTVTVISACASLVAAWLLVRVWNEPDEMWLPRAESYAMLATLVLAQVAWTHYFIFLIPVVAVLLERHPGASRVDAIVAWSCVGICCWPILPPQHVAPDAAGSLRTLTPALAALCLWGAVSATTYRAVSSRHVAREGLDRV